MTLRSRFSKLNAIIAPAFTVLCLGAMAGFIAFLSLEDLNSGKVDSIFKTPIYGSVLLVGALIGTGIHYLKILKTIRISNQGIRFRSLLKSEFVPWDRIAKIDLLGKSHKLLSPAEATILNLDDGQKLEIVASLYENMAMLRTALGQIAAHLEAKEPFELEPIAEIPVLEPAGLVNVSKMTNYRGNHLLSFNGMVIYAWIAFSVYFLFATNPSFPFGVGLLFLSGFFYGFLGSQLHYFCLDDHYLVVKNHIWPWINQAYRLDDIKQVVFETPFRRSTSLRVITQGYQSKLYPGGSLGSKTWKALLRDLQGLGVDTRNEAI